MIHLLYISGALMMWQILCEKALRMKGWAGVTKRKRLAWDGVVIQNEKQIQNHPPTPSSKIQYIDTKKLYLIPGSRAVRIESSREGRARWWSMLHSMPKRTDPGSRQEGQKTQGIVSCKEPRGKKWTKQEFYGNEEKCKDLRNVRCRKDILWGII